MKKILILSACLFLSFSCGGDDPILSLNDSDSLVGDGGDDREYGGDATSNDADSAKNDSDQKEYGGEATSNDADSAKNDSDQKEYGGDSDSLVGDGGDDREEGGDATSNDADSAKNDSDQKEYGGDSDSVEQKCGNGAIEAGEICDGETVLCSDLDPIYVGGNAYCKESCNGWNVDECKRKNLLAVATIPATSFTADYLYNGPNELMNAANRNNELRTSPLFSASIALPSGETYYIPHSQSDTHWISTAYDSTSIQLFQRSYYCGGGDPCPLSLPYIMLGIYLPEVLQGATLSIGITDENPANFVVFDMMNDVECVILVGYGTVTINSVNVSPGSLGNFSFTTSDVDLYLTSKTPEGDMTAEIQSAGYTICQ